MSSKNIATTITELAQEARGDAEIKIIEDPFELNIPEVFKDTSGCIMSCKNKKDKE